VNIFVYDLAELEGNLLNGECECASLRVVPAGLMCRICSRRCSISIRTVITRLMTAGEHGDTVDDADYQMPYQIPQIRGIFGRSASAARSVGI